MHLFKVCGLSQPLTSYRVSEFRTVVRFRSHSLVLGFKASHPPTDFRVGGFRTHPLLLKPRRGRSPRPVAHGVAARDRDPPPAARCRRSAACRLAARRPAAHAPRPAATANKNFYPGSWGSVDHVHHPHPLCLCELKQMLNLHSPYHAGTSVSTTSSM